RHQPGAPAARHHLGGQPVEPARPIPGAHGALTGPPRGRSRGHSCRPMVRTADLAPATGTRKRSLRWVRFVVIGLDSYQATEPMVIDQVRVLVVDDSPTTRSMLREALDLAGGIEVVGEANDGAEAVALTTESQPDVVLMDIRMPRGDGIRAAREITSRYPATKVVAL